jgi:hypothetical protein
MPIRLPNYYELTYFTTPVPSIREITQINTDKNLIILICVNLWNLWFLKIKIFHSQNEDKFHPGCAYLLHHIHLNMHTLCLTEP